MTIIIHLFIRVYQIDSTKENDYEQILFRKVIFFFWWVQLINYKNATIDINDFSLERVECKFLNLTFSFVLWQHNLVIYNICFFRLLTLEKAQELLYGFNLVPRQNYNVHAQTQTPNWKDATIY